MVQIHQRAFISAKLSRRGVLSGYRAELDKQK